MEYQSPGAAISDGLRQGLGLAAQYSQIKQQRDQAQWERDLKIAEMGMKLTENKNLPVDQRMNAFNKGVRPILTRMGIHMPEMTAATAMSDSFQDAVKNSNGIIDQMQEGKLDPHVGFKAITQHFTGALKDMTAESEGQKTQRELIVSNAKDYVDRADKAATKSSDHTPTQAEAIKRQTELQIQLANLNKTDMNSQITADALKKAGFNVEAGKVTPEMVEQVKKGVQKELSFLNTLIPEERFRHKFGEISPEEAAKLKESGYTPDEIRRDFTIKGIPSHPGVAKASGAMPMPTAGEGAVPTARPATPPPMTPPAPMAAPAPASFPTAGPLSLSGGAVQSTQAGPLKLSDQSLQ